MSLRIAFDLDGVLADLDSAYRAIVERLFGSGPAGTGESSDREPLPSGDDTAAAGATPPGAARRAGLTSWEEDDVWAEIRSTPDFWTTLDPLEPGVLGRLQELARRYRWEIFFVTQRPDTAGDTTQRQTQRWLMAHGFEMPSVLVLSGSRGKVAYALTLDFLVDDSPRHGIDVVSESAARAILILRNGNPGTARSARQMGLDVVGTVDQALDVLERTSVERSQPGLLWKLAKTIGLTS